MLSIPGVGRAGRVLKCMGSGPCDYDIENRFQFVSQIVESLCNLAVIIPKPLSVVA